MNKKVLKILSYIFTILSFLYIGISIYKMNLTSLKINSPLKACGIILILSFVYACFFSLLPLAWKIIIEFINNGEVKVTFKEIYIVYVKANIAKYLPGNVMEFVLRNVLGKKLGWSHTEIAWSSILENLIILFVASMMTILFSYRTAFTFASSFLPKIELRTFLLIIFAGIVILSFLSILVFKFLKDRFNLNPKKYFQLKFFKILLKTSALYLFIFINLSLTLILIYTSIFKVNLDFNLCLKLISAFTLSWILGFITPGAPGGIGVKEAILLALLGNVIGKEITLATVVIHRLISILGDIFAYFFGLYINKRNVQTRTFTKCS